MNEIKLGIIGTNFVSDWLAESAEKVDGISVAAVYSRKNETGDAFAEKHGIQCVFSDFDAFLGSDIDAVYIASPNSCHYSQTEAALKHGKHVLLEKPAALCENDFAALSSLAHESGLILLEAMRPVHDPVMERVRECIGKIGKIRRAVFEFCQYSSRYDKFKNGEIMNAFDPKFGNGAVMDIGVYAIEACVMLFGEPLEVRSKSMLFENGMEGMGRAVLSYGDFDAEIVYSKIYDSVTPSYIAGECGAVTIGKISTGENVFLKLRGEEERQLMTERPENNMVYEIADFVGMIRGGRDTEIYDGYTGKTLRVIDEIRRQNGIVF